MEEKRVCVYCGSRTGHNGAYTSFARNLGRSLAQYNFGLVFGAGSIGLMNEVANAVIENDGYTHGVIPEHLTRREQTHANLSKLDITTTMHERKATMAENAHAFIAMPGGFGTFEELLETITWAQLGLHQKPIIIANVDGYYDSLLSFFNRAITAEFIAPENRDLFYTVNSVEQCMTCLLDRM